jgi:Ca2+-binding EF-hand superfamily protein
MLMLLAPPLTLECLLDFGLQQDEIAALRKVFQVFATNTFTQLTALQFGDVLFNRFRG